MQDGGQETGCFMSLAALSCHIFHPLPSSED